MRQSFVSGRVQWDSSDGIQSPKVEDVSWDGGACTKGSWPLGRAIQGKQSVSTVFSNCLGVWGRSNWEYEVSTGKGPLLFKSGHSSLIINKPNIGILKQFVLGIEKEVVCVCLCVCVFLISHPVHQAPTPGTPRLNKILLMSYGFNIASGSSRYHKILS